MRQRTGAGRRHRPGTALVALLAGGLLLAGCTSSSDSATSDEGGAGQADMRVDEERSEAGGADEAAPEDGDNGEAGERGSLEDIGTVSEVPDPSQLIQSASISVVVETLADGHAEAVRLTQRAGGYVSDESTSGGEGGIQYSMLTLRVPADEYAPLLTELSDLGDLTHRELTTEDVGDEIVDVESRLETQRESIERVRALMDEAESLEDIVRLESELSRRQAELESLEARIASLRGDTALATISLELMVEDEVETESEKDDDRPSVVDALGGGLEFVWLLLVWLAIAVGASLPVIALLALLWLLWRLLGHRLPLDRLTRGRHPRHIQPPPPVTAPPPLTSPGKTPDEERGNEPEA
ncbi:DUF4349 domain-containing protein [Streptomyces profundus]|uniref:DUF4349 domain-containing protein n=1 Tax=Streptomyces profundus TaxID=2867410 RepID=UPI001D16C4D9|nr:DUF4349 domain-containing protein [Streptomyces sp. MA3_2.13]UED87073.1 DUF4349 domain-containing protein [Streptomyces sp. MA3_2.13]